MPRFAVEATTRSQRLVSLFLCVYSPGRFLTATSTSTTITSTIHTSARKCTKKMPVEIVSNKDVGFIGQELASQIDQELFNEYGFKVEQLMEIAGLAAAKAVFAQYPKGSVLVLAGPGNNGGDGFVCARHLQQFGFKPTIVYPKDGKAELMQALKKQCQALEIPVLTSLPPLSDFTLVVDALFGFSFKPPVREPFGAMIEAITEAGIKVFSIDIPSGWDVEKGPPSEGPYIRPHALISLTAPKRCMSNFTGPHFLGGRFVPSSLVKKHSLRLPVYPGSDQIVKIDEI